MGGGMGVTAPALMFPTPEDLRRALATPPSGFQEALAAVLLPGPDSPRQESFGFLLREGADAMAWVDRLREQAVPVRPRAETPSHCRVSDMDGLLARFIGPGGRGEREKRTEGERPRLLLVRGGPESLREALSLALEFRTEGLLEVASITWGGEEDPAYLLKIPQLSGAYPRLRWGEDPTRTALLTRVGEGKTTVWIPEGWRLKAPEILPFLEAGERIMIPAGRMRLPEDLTFRRLSEVARVEPASPLKTLFPKTSGEGAFAGLTLRVRLQEGPPHPRAAAPYAMDRASLREELRDLRERQLDLAARAERLDHLLEPAPRLYRFSGEGREAVARFVSHWPSRILERFVVAALSDTEGQSPDLWLAAAHLEPDVDPPAEVGSRGQAFTLDLGASQLPGEPLRLFLPFGHTFQPFLAHADTASLRRALGLPDSSPERGREWLAVSPQEDRLWVRALPEQAFEPLSRAAATLNRLLRTKTLLTVRERSVVEGEEAVAGALQRLRLRLREAREGYHAQARVYLSGLEEETASLLARLGEGEAAVERARKAAETVEGARNAMEEAGKAGTRRLADHARKVGEVLLALAEEQEADSASLTVLADSLRTRVELLVSSGEEAAGREEGALARLKAQGEVREKALLERLAEFPPTPSSRALAVAQALEEAARRLRDGVQGGGSQDG